MSSEHLLNFSGIVLLEFPCTDQIVSMMILSTVGSRQPKLYVNYALPLIMHYQNASTYSQGREGEIPHQRNANSNLSTAGTFGCELKDSPVGGVRADSCGRMGE